MPYQIHLIVEKGSLIRQHLARCADCGRLKTLETDTKHAAEHLLGALGWHKIKKRWWCADCPKRLPDPLLLPDS